MMIKFKPRIYLNHDSVLVSEAILKEFVFLEVSVTVKKKIALN